ncbi:hypothetical protein A45J_2728 [hot springs metagenome]|uniref:Uncharacterized protein n=1 Tax=hot springs metagenome TaxID=433727 RepID=A0A5J4L6N4_9ZZZZ
MPFFCDKEDAHAGNKVFNGLISQGLSYLWGERPAGPY